MASHLSNKLRSSHMPKTKRSRARVSRKIRFLKKEGKSQKEAVAQALNRFRRKDL